MILSNLCVPGGNLANWLCFFRETMKHMKIPRRDTKYEIRMLIRIYSVFVRFLTFLHIFGQIFKTCHRGSGESGAIVNHKSSIVNTKVSCLLYSAILIICYLYIKHNPIICQMIFLFFIEDYAGFADICLSS